MGWDPQRIGRVSKLQSTLGKVTDWKKPCDGKAFSDGLQYMKNMIMDLPEDDSRKQHCRSHVPKRTKQAVKSVVRVVQRVSVFPRREGGGGAHRRGARYIKTHTQDLRFRSAQPGPAWPSSGAGNVHRKTHTRARLQNSVQADDGHGDRLQPPLAGPAVQA